MKMMTHHGFAKFWTALLAILIMPLCAEAATYYVATNGNDANPGTLELPWRTIQKCANTINGGDDCVVKNGSYTENVNVTRSGSAEKYLTLKAENSRQAIVQGKIGVSGSYVRVDGFKVVIPGGGQGGIGVSGSYSQITGCYITPGTNVLGLNNTALSVAGSNNTASSNYIEKTCFGIGLLGDRNIVEDNEVTRLKMNGSCGDVDYMRFFGTNHIIRNNNFHGIIMEEIGKAHVDCFQTFDNGGPQYSIKNVIVEGNFCSDAAQGMMLEGKLYKQSSGLIVRNNVFTRNGAWCVCAMDIADVRFYNNTCDTTGGLHGMWCRGGNNVASCEFKNNIIYGSGSLYGVMETAKLIDGDSASPGKNNLLFKTNQYIKGYAGDIINSDPLFIDRKADDYRIKAESPARDAGAALTNWPNPKDKNEVSRPQGTRWDIGAFEYNGDMKPPGNLLVFPPQ
jgi:hypothetical protein